ncbi:hypothetical protein D3C83_58810 [compost metagenome]
MNAAYSCGVPPTGSAPSSLMRLCTSGSFRIRAVSCESRLTTVLDVRAGATSPNQDTATSPGTPASSAVGISGAAGVRLREPTASARILPAFASGR